MYSRVFISGFLIMLSGAFQSFAQQGYTYREYDRDVCISTERVYSRIPDEVYFHVQLIEGTFYAIFNDEVWFDDFFSGGTTNALTRSDLSLGVQLVSTEYFSCTRFSMSNPDDYFYYLEPLSFKQMKRLQFTTRDGTFIIPLGAVPQKFMRREFDYGIIISRRNRECIKHWYTKTPFQDWDLLENAFLLDTLLFDSDPVVFPTHIPVVTMDARLDFDVVFPKNEITFSKDSLRRFLAHVPTICHDPVRISISAFASIEGPEDRNKELYEKRAEVIHNEIALMFPQITDYEIRVDENWDDFYRDVARGPFAYLREMTPDQIRLKLAERAFNEQMEPLLKRHRKATVSIYLQRSVDPQSSTLAQLHEFYIETLRAADLESALTLQDAIFRLAKHQKVAVRFPDSLPMPPKKEFVRVFNRDYLIRYKTGLADQQQLHNLFARLNRVYPGDPQVNYNLSVIVLNRWLGGDKTIGQDSVLSSINSLGRYGVPENIQNRLLVNYHLVSIRQSMADRDARARSRSVRAIRNLYGAAHVKEPELVNLASFFVAYRQNDVAERLLRPFARTSEPDENLLYYYIALTINQPSTANQRWYTQLLEKAQEMNPQRFCNLFQPVSVKDAAGISLLFRDRIKDLYCKHCSGPL